MVSALATVFFTGEAAVSSTLTERRTVQFADRTELLVMGRGDGAVDGETVVTVRRPGGSPVTLVTGTRGGPTPFGRALLERTVSSGDGWIRTGAVPRTGRPEFEKVSDGRVVRIGTFPNGAAFAGLAGQRAVQAASVEAAVAAADQLLGRG